ncbi:MAG: hypothetical protein J0H29_14820 [Sphingobacteriales bacterium]|nr:hypothetical protein [Sphingobacteriales bacterium]
MKLISYLLCCAMWFVACNSKPVITEVLVDCPRDTGAIPFTSFEDLTSPKFESLRARFHPDTVFHNEQDEFKRILLLRSWISGIIKISDFEPDYPGQEYADRILEAALKGQGFHCGHYMIVQNAVMNAYGYVTRCIGAGAGVKNGEDGHHGANEIWSNTFNKWFLSDAKYDHHFEKDGIPLSALEVREEYLKNKGKDVQMVKGSSRNVIGADSLKDEAGKWKHVNKEAFMQTFTWIAWEASNDRFVHWPDNGDALANLLIYKDEYSDKNTWIWDGKPHWAYAAKRFTPIADKNAIEWHPNNVLVHATFVKDKAAIRLRSRMPNLKTFQMKNAEDGSWQNIGDSVVLTYTGQPEKIFFRPVNLAGVTGKECSITLR